MRPGYLQKMFPVAIAMVMGMTLFISGCDRDKTPVTSESRENTVSPEQENILARVQGEPVTDFDVEQAALKMLGAQQATLLDEAGRKKVLESLVLGKALSRAAKKEMDAEELTLLEWKVMSYREQLLVNRYLRRHADPQPVTEKMIKEYYDANPERFGGRTVREYELITSSKRLDGTQREQVLAELAGVDAKKDWRRYVESLTRKNLPLQFRQGRTNTDVLIGELQSMLDRLDIDEVSKPFFTGGKIYIARIISKTKTPPRPLNEVSADIRKALAPVQLKKAIREVSDKILNEVNVEYIK